ncbi:alpha/beta hydrolase [Acinetobacter seifertii]|uniref:Alpha/beta hydrolase n=1 Tax=Acinetobacter seifertii TaxID=1530123 RepID=A0A7H2PYR1_9GAMM|nr:alpha/beta hydrolase [Acinetobacter seifertii]
MNNYKAKLSEARTLYKEFRLYDLGSFALNRFTPKDGFEQVLNVRYGLKPRHRLDIYRSTKRLAHRPLIVFVHGGAWQHGNKRDYLFVGEAFAKEGYDVAVINYQLAPKNIFPSYVEDLTQALNYLHQNQEKLEISTENTVLMGHSAGAFNVMSAVYHPDSTKIECLGKIKAIVGLAGPYHFDYKGDPLAEDAFDQDISYKEVMPYYFVNQNNIKHYLLMAENDQIVKQHNTLDMDQALREKGNHSHIAIIPKTGHITILASLSSFVSHYFKTKRTILHFLDEVF